MLTLEDLENESIKKLDGPLPSAPEALAVEAAVSPPAFCVHVHARACATCHFTD